MESCSTHNPSSAKSSNVLANLSRDTAAQVAGSVLCSGSMLVMNLLVVRLLGRDDYGGLGVLQSFAQWCATIFAFGGSLSVTILSGRRRHGDKSEVLGAVSVYVAVAIALTACAVVVERQIGLFGTSNQLTRGAGLAVVCYAGLLVFFEGFGGVLRGADQFRLSNMLSVGQAIALAVGSIAGAWMFSDSVATFWGGNLLACAVMALIGWQAVRMWGISWRGLDQARQVGLSVGMRSYVVQSTEIIAETFGVIYLARVADLPGAAAVIGCQRLCTIVSKPAAMVCQVLQGKVAGQKSGRAEAETTLKVARTTFLIALVSCAPLLLFVRQFTEFALGAEFRDCAAIMACFLLGAVLRGHASAAVGFILGQGCPKSYVGLKFIVMMVTIAGTVLLYKPWGTFAVAFLYLVTSLMLMVGIGWMVMRQAKQAPEVTQPLPAAKAA